MRKKMFLFLCVLFTLNMNAQDVDSLFDLSLEELMEIEVVSSSKVQQKKELAPNVISVFPNKIISNFGWNNIDQVLTKHQGFFPSQDFDRRTVGFRGVSEGWNNNHLLLLIDGVPFNDNLYGTAYTWEITPLFFANSVEVIRGPGSALYGTNATNGVITINTITPKNLKNNFILRTQYGERNTQIYDFMAAFSAKNFDIVTSLSYRKTDGLDYMSYVESGRTETDGSRSKFKIQDNRQSSYLFTKFSGKNKLAGFNFQYHRQDWNYKTGHGWLWQIPDKPETMKENRDILVIKYTYPFRAFVVPEFVVRYQIHRIDWDMWYYPTNAFDGFYPDGVNEYLKTSAQDIFTRFQFRFDLPKKMNAIIGVEPTVFLYSGDKEHYSNTDLNDAGGFLYDLNYDGEITDDEIVPAGEGWYAPFPNNENRQMGDWFEFITNKPVTNIGSFFQISSGELLGKKIQLTTGIRYDNEFYKYIDIYSADKDENQKTFDQFSPRAALIIAPTNKFSMKITAGKAFRAPTPTEMFGANTWTLASNLEQLVAEKIISYDIEFNFNILEHFYLNIVAYHTDFTGLIAYSLGNNNLSTNVYDIRNAGFESNFSYSRKNTFAFANLSYIQRTNETIFEAEKEWISEHDKRLTWAPAYFVNMGVSQKIGNFNLSFNGHWQSKVLRRDLDLYSEDEYTALGFTELPRENEIPGWFSIDTKFSYSYKFAEIGIDGKNLLDKDQFIAKSLKYPFDYKYVGRRVGAFMIFRF